MVNVTYFVWERTKGRSMDFDVGGGVFLVFIFLSEACLSGKRKIERTRKLILGPPISMVNLISG